jgi:hypothetical protein
MTFREHELVSYALHLAENGGKLDPKMRGRWNLLTAADRKTIRLLQRNEIVRSGSAI